MDAKRIELLRKKLADSDSPNVSIFAGDFCELVDGSKIEDEGLQKAAKAMKGHVGKVAVDRKKVEEMLAKVAPKATGTQKGSSNKS